MSLLNFVLGVGAAWSAVSLLWNILLFALFDVYDRKIMLKDIAFWAALAVVLILLQVWT